ncbi:MAG TPA: RlmE family RNA methyltransferase [Candidatus Eisenbacteria bacterium]|nr:RlmE family RNA methyltransferase [Candidatus Eisenbacteria bacterium]
MIERMRISDARRDYYRNLAKNTGYRSRSAYKLLQLNRSYRLFRPQYTVIDIGSAPGGWLQVAKQQVGDHGMVVGIDIAPVQPIEGVTILRGSIVDTSIFSTVLNIVGARADIILSDLSPNMSGIWDLDHNRQISLTRSALVMALKLLRRGGTSVFKVFEGESLDGLKQELKNHFQRVYINKPKASRQKSSEQYIVCFGFEPYLGLEGRGKKNLDDT